MPRESRGRRGSKHHLLVDPSGIPLAATVTGGNRNDVTQLRIGRPRQRADALTADRGDDQRYLRTV